MDIDRHQMFAERVVRNQQRVYRYIVSLVPNQADAEELLQQTVLTLWEHWDRYDPSLEFFSWACGIAHNHIRNFLRKKQNSQVLLDEDVLEMLSVRSVNMKRHDDMRLEMLRDCLSQLPEKNRSVIEGYYNGCAVKEIARQKSITSKVVYKLLDRMRLLLHDCLSAGIAEEGTA
ncbi:sigma-70 family RNA polymerase sigma factor [Calycomorphotria hydatis]|uniref:RNA polymerase sigma factor CarQ n=1 Tax=Calycomorphotria hydatis TaxID=2528027 RepID=A0A517T976_9PLAN|nr:sigma-70 family RNA polymerase sigma factor [Calycomorphotria hydatis]QDT64935.1 RNA polymerase sigma factor CarQ [Calycomorphotria hydatis]